jgi:hypothetical protein
MKKTSDKVKTEKTRTRFPGITEDAKKLGVNRVTLWRVATGRWKSRSLMRRYRQLKGGGK